MKPTSRHATGQVGEFLVAAELARNDFAVAILTGNAGEIDILARGHDKTFSVQVKSAARGHHQFRLDKFLKVDCADNVHQIVHGVREDLDPGIILALVLIGDCAGEDKILWTTLGAFANLLAEGHTQYLEANGGKRPGKNPNSYHASVSWGRFVESGIGKDLMDLFG